VANTLFRKRASHLATYSSTKAKSISFFFSKM
jgi:hypothetical protein